MTSMLYNNPNAGTNAYMLMEELSRLFSPAGWVELHKTTRGDGRGDGTEYPPVYRVRFVPNQREEFTSEWLRKFEEIAEKYEAKITVRADRGTPYRSAHLYVEYEAR